MIVIEKKKEISGQLKKQQLYQKRYQEETVEIRWRVENSHTSYTSYLKKELFQLYKKVQIIVWTKSPLIWTKKELFIMSDVGCFNCMKYFPCALGSIVIVNLIIVTTIL